MLFGGIDIGSRAAKGVLMRDDEIISSVITDTLAESVLTSTTTMELLLKGTGVKLNDIDYIVATGYGRVLVPFAKENVSEISCHARGVNWYFPSVRTILDMGGQDSKAISVDGEGRVTNFVMNDKCAGGTGRFLEMIAEVLGVSLAESGRLALKSKGSIPFNTICAVFAKTEAIAYRRQGVAKADILAGLNAAISQRSHNLLKRVGIAPDFAISGGISKNKGMVAKLTEKVGMEPKLSDDPQLIGALGAALFARERQAGQGPEEMKVQYGYDDATGSYYITLDSARCDGCGKCVPVCPAGLWAVTGENGARQKAGIRDELRKKISYLCPGEEACRAKIGETCQGVCPKDAIRHSW